jgi:hypothetical protein
VAKDPAEAAKSEYGVNFKLLGLFPVSKANVNVIDSQAVKVLGTPFGIKLYTDGVLVVKVENGVDYAMYSSYNMGMFSEGIQKWDDTTMLDPSLCSDYWFIDEVTEGGTALDSAAPADKSIRTLHFNLLRQRITSV